VIWGGAMLVLFATNDLGSALLYYGIFLALLYIATARLSFVAGRSGSSSSGRSWSGARPRKCTSA
jgi:cell division protein FtsW (lipid II flippase)